MLPKLKMYPKVGSQKAENPGASNYTFTNIQIGLSTKTDGSYDATDC